MIKIYHIYFQQQSSYGGIESLIRSLVSDKQFASKWIQPKAFWNSVETAEKVIFHSLHPFIVLNLFKSIIFKDNVILFTHFHKVSTTKRPKSFYVYMQVLKVLFWFIRKKVIFVHNSILACSDFKKYVQFGKHRVQGFGLNVEQFKDRKTLAAIRLNKEMIYDFIYVARNDEVKNIPIFLDIAKSLHSYRFCLVSDYNYETPVNVSLFKAVSSQNLSELLSASKLFLSTSKYESLGIAIAEAEYHGVPSITTRMTGYNNNFDQDQLYRDYNFYIDLNDHNLTETVSKYLESFDDNFLNRAIVNKLQERALTISNVEAQKVFSSIIHSTT